ncbi:unnamed protein product [Pedinophyceae sp. YPF-701]|nr:unnamed protein product [Pedinophyceae sp. YPF-701]
MVSVAAHAGARGDAEPHAPRQVPLKHSDTTLMERVPAASRVVVTWENVCAYVPVLDTPGARQGDGPAGALKRAASSVSALGVGRLSDREKSTGSHGAASAAGARTRQILHGVSGSVEPGHVMALMGPSGSGKTSLLSLLGGRRSGAVEVSGHMLFNGDPLSRAVKRKIGFVLQDDLLFEALTVYETLWYAAALRLPRSMTAEDRRARVEVVIQALGLGKCAHTIIGSAARRGVSGGERKRVSIGHELLTQPSVILMDEPTSGLDSTTALRLVQTMRVLAEGGRAIITTIHQPSSRMFRMLDQLLLLSSGRTLYYGAACNAVKLFAGVGHPLPDGTNPAEHLLDLASGGVTEAGLALPAPDELAAEDAVVAANVEAAEEGLRSARAAMTERVSEAEAAGWAGTDARGATWVRQVAILVSRSLRTRRFDSLGLDRAVTIFSVGLLVGLFWFQRGGDSDRLTLEGMEDLAGLIFFEVLFMAFNTTLTSVFTFPSEFQMILKERALNFGARGATVVTSTQLSYYAASYYACTAAAARPR